MTSGNRYAGTVRRRGGPACCLHRYVLPDRLNRNIRHSETPTGRLAARQAGQAGATSPPGLEPDEPISLSSVPILEFVGLEVGPYPPAPKGQVMRDPDNRARMHRAWLPWAGWLALPLALACWHGGNLAAERIANAASGPLWVSESPLDDTTRLLTVVDQESRRIAIYQINTATGTLTLRSTRDISWDLMVGDFNAQEPRPAALQKMLQLPPAERPR